MTRSTSLAQPDTRYRRRSTPLSHPRPLPQPDLFDDAVADLRLHGVRGDILMPSAPARAPWGIARLGARATSLLAAVLATTLGVGIFTSTAYFTDNRAIDATISVGSVDLGMRSVSGKTLAEEPLALSALTPLSSTSASDNAKGGIVSFKLKPATLSTRAVVTAFAIPPAAVANPTAQQTKDAAAQTELLKHVLVNFSTDNGANWTTATPLPTNSLARSLEMSIAGKPSSSTFLTDVVKVRFILAPNTPTELQSTPLRFSIGVRSIQSSAPAGTAIP